MSVATERRSAIIVGSSGQDGVYLGRFLDELNYDLTRVTRSAVVEGAGSPEPFSILDAVAVASLVSRTRPAEIYYLAAFHHSSEEIQPNTADLVRNSMAVHFDGLLNFLSAVVAHSPDTRLFLASSVLVFGELTSSPQSEDTPLRPNSAYGLSKAAAMNLCKLFREQMGVFASSGILYNHESPLRGPTFASKKIARAVVDAFTGKVGSITLGNLDTQVDWSAAEDTVRAAHAVLQIDQPRDFIIASGETHSVREFAEAAYGSLGLDYERYVGVDQSILHREANNVPRCGNPELLHRLTPYRPRVMFREMVAGIVAAELEARS